MKVLHVVPTYLPATRYGGPIYSVHGLCKALVEQGVEVDVATTSVDGNTNSPVPHDRFVDMDGVRIRYFRSSRLRRLYWSSQMAAWLARHINDYDLVHVHSVFLWPTLSACREALRRNVPYVLSPRGMLVKSLIEAKNQWIKKLWIAMFDRRHVCRASALHVTSLIEQTELARVVSHDVPTWVIPNGVPHVAENHWQGSPEGDRVLFIGRINWKKGLEQLIRAVALGAKGHFVIAGNDEEFYTEKLKTLVAEFDLAHRFEFLSAVYGESKVALIRGSDIFIMPSINENFGIAALEAMAQGCPTIVSNTSGIAGEVAEDSLLTADITPEALKEAINTLIDDKEKRQALSTSGFASARLLSWPSIAVTIKRLYEGLIS